MAIMLTNVSFDGSPVQFRLDSPLLACFDPLTLDMLAELAPPGTPVDTAALLERINVHHPAMACYTIPDFRPGLFTLDPRDIKEFGDDDEDLNYGDAEEELGFADKRTSFPFVGVDSGALIVADVAHLPELGKLLTWKNYELALQNEQVIAKIVIALGGPFFALMHGGSLPGMVFDGDGTYTIPVRCVRRCSG